MSAIAPPRIQNAGRTDPDEGDDPDHGANGCRNKQKHMHGNPFGRRDGAKRPLTGESIIRVYRQEADRLTGLSNDTNTTARTPDRRLLHQVNYGFDYAVCAKRENKKGPVPCYSGGRSPGDMIHSVICEPVLACRALRNMASRPGPGERVLACSRSRLASWASRSSRNLLDPLTL